MNPTSVHIVTVLYKFITISVINYLNLINKPITVLIALTKVKFPGLFKVEYACKIRFPLTDLQVPFRSPIPSKT